MNLYRLNRLILIDSYKPGTLQEVRLDGPTNLNGVNGAGKTTLLRLIPLFFGESPSRLVPKSRVNESFVQHYLPHDSSYIIFEYRRPRQTCQVVIYASPNEGGLSYRFADKGFELEDFVHADAEGARMPVSCRDLARHLRKKGVFCSPQLTARNDYRTVIQNLPHAKGAEMRQLIARFSFCDSVNGRRLQHIEKIVTGMFMRSTDFRDLREMLVSCIEEDRESITLELRTDTLNGWFGNTAPTNMRMGSGSVWRNWNGSTKPQAPSVKNWRNWPRAYAALRAARGNSTPPRKLVCGNRSRACPD